MTIEMASEKRTKISRRFQLQTEIDVPGYVEITEGLMRRGLFRQGDKNSRFHLTASQAATIAAMMILDGKLGTFVEKMIGSDENLVWSVTAASEGFNTTDEMSLCEGLEADHPTKGYFQLQIAESDTI